MNSRTGTSELTQQRKVLSTLFNCYLVLCHDIFVAGTKVLLETKATRQGDAEAIQNKANQAVWDWW